MRRRRYRGGRAAYLDLDEVEHEKQVHADFVL